MKKIYLLLILILFIGCEKEEIILPQSQDNLLLQFQSQFNLTKYEDPFVRDNLKVNWNKVPETEVNVDFHEFSTNIYSTLDKEDTNLFYKYSVVAKLGQENKWGFHIVKFTAFVNGELNKVSLKNPGKFTGTVHQYNLAGILVKIEGLKEGKVVSTYKGNPALQNPDSKYHPADWDDPSDAGRWQTIRTESWRDYWNLSYNSSGQLTHIRYSGSYQYNVRTEYIYVPANVPAPGSGNYTGNNTYHQHQNAPHGPAVNQNPHSYEEELEEEPDVIFEERINDTNLDNCLKTILNSINSHQHGVGEVIVEFSQNNNSNYNWTIQSGSLTGGTGETKIQYDTNTNTATTTFDSQAWLNASDLSWARTILHESVHANVVSISNDGTLTAQERQDLLGSNWIIAYINNGHDYIANTYVESIADVLQEYGQYEGYSMNRQFYEDLAWGGLQGTNAFNQLTSLERTRILNLIAIELTGKDINGNIKPKKGKNAGC